LLENAQPEIERIMKRKEEPQKVKINVKPPNEP
jgi:hypothetical protein